MHENNLIDFANLQTTVLNVLSDPDHSPIVTDEIKFVMVDEYQDTNYVQEQILLKLTADHRNLCVVGDEDQSLYRFRGATVRNILEFSQRLEGCKVVKLTTNYRSHRDITHRYDRWMSSLDWSNPSGVPFRYSQDYRTRSRHRVRRLPIGVRDLGKRPTRRGAAICRLGPISGEEWCDHRL